MGAQAIPDVDTEFISLAGKTIAPCDGCSDCLEKGECVIKDDMTPIYPKLLEADAIVVGSPVYYGTVSGLCKAFMERVQGFGVHEKKLRFKVGGAISVAGSRSGGRELALMTIHMWCHINDMIPIGIVSPNSQLGVTGLGSLFDTKAVHEDKWQRQEGPVTATESAWLYGRKIATVTKIVQAGLKATALDMPDKPYGFLIEKDYPKELYTIE